MAVGKLPVSKADVKMAKKHLKASIKLEKKKVKDHVKAAKSAKSSASKSYNLAHAKGHQKDIKQRQQYAKRVSRMRGK